MENVIKIFREIQSTSGKNDKQSIIAKNNNNELFKRCLIFLLDGNVVTGISTSKLKKKVDVQFRGMLGYIIGYISEEASDNYYKELRESLVNEVLHMTGKDLTKCWIWM